MSAGSRAGIFVPIGFLFLHLKLTIMSTKFAIIGVVSVLGVGAVMHHARFCPLHEMMVALHHKNAQTVAVKKAPAPVSAKAEVATLAMK